MLVAHFTALQPQEVTCPREPHRVGVHDAALNSHELPLSRERDVDVIDGVEVEPPDGGERV